MNVNRRASHRQISFCGMIPKRAVTPVILHVAVKTIFVIFNLIEDETTFSVEIPSSLCNEVLFLEDLHAILHSMKMPVFA